MVTVVAVTERTAVAVADVGVFTLGEVTGVAERPAVAVADVNVVAVGVARVADCVRVTVGVAAVVADRGTVAVGAVVAVADRMAVAVADVTVADRGAVVVADWVWVTAGVAAVVADLGAVAVAAVAERAAVAVADVAVVDRGDVWAARVCAESLVARVVSRRTDRFGWTDRSGPRRLGRCWDRWFNSCSRSLASVGLVVEAGELTGLVPEGLSGTRCAGTLAGGIPPLAGCLGVGLLCPCALSDKKKRRRQSAIPPPTA